ncbi:MAG: formyltransferase family protein [Alphaproteobacteria bacterium]
MSNAVIKPVRVAVFGSYYQGNAVVDKILELQRQNPEAVRLVGVATDDPTHPRVSPERRIWQFVTDKREYVMVPEKAASNDVSVWNGSVKKDDFYRLFAEEWRPDICYMATFGQRVPMPVFDFPRFGFYNFHPAVDRTWPSYVGGNPFKGMIDAKEPHCSIAMHSIDEEFDHGPLVAFSEHVPIGANDTILSMYLKTCPATADMVHWHLGELKIVPPYNNYKPKLAPSDEAAMQVA